MMIQFPSRGVNHNTDVSRLASSAGSAGSLKDSRRVNLIWRTWEIAAPLFMPPRVLPGSPVSKTATEYISLVFWNNNGRVSQIR